MYLVSVYFDDESSEKIQRLINKVGDKSGNKFMIEGKVPPHITIAAFQTKEESKVIEILGNNIKDIKDTIITWASIGIFKSSVIFLAPVLNKGLHNISVCINKGLSLVDDIAISKFYLPFQWMPHTTIAKKLSREELMIAFQELEKNFTIFSGRITKIGLSSTNPYEDIIVWKL
ncbi:2'-5' RNA ligase family protein [uncultured Clostridium sp.]|uniref:2'-5' RNA ligase family protein n=1 Tax=uncultured Clostridium sp. TaxID=59620 RepID=UPI00260154C2|nr:2'-5' RNA ligase family protein [uncultured Clostridium sp.]